MTKKNRPKRFYDYSLLFCIIFLSVFGLVMIYSASSYTAQLKYNNAGYFMMRQLKIGAGGLVLALIISKLDYHWYAKFSMFAYLLSYVLMIAVTLVGKKVNGKKRWLGIGSLSFQPTEFVKIALIIFLAVLITRMGASVNTWKNMVRVMGFALPIAGIVAANNLSSGIIIAGIAFVMLFVACKKQWPFYACGGLALLTVVTAGPLAIFLEKIKLLKPYQLSRIHVWLSPESYPMDGGYQVLQGLYAIGSGGLFGKGLGESIQKMGFVPEAQNDMIFSIVCEELGIAGGVMLLLMFAYLLYRLFFIAQNASDLLGSLMVTGIFIHIALQVIFNVAVVLNLMPNTGVTLPFISYGGTSIMFLMAEMGLALSVARQIKFQDM